MPMVNRYSCGIAGTVSMALKRRVLRAESADRKTKIYWHGVELDEFDGGNINYKRN